MSIFKSTFEHRDFYNQSVKQYNQSRNKIEAITEIRAHRDMLIDLEQRREREITEHFKGLQAILKTITLSTDPHEKQRKNDLGKAVQKIVDALSTHIANEDHIDSSELTLKQLKTAINSAFRPEEIAFYPASTCIKKAEEICRLGESIDTCRDKQRHLNRLMDQAAEQDYPAELKKWEEPAAKKEQNLQGAALIRHKKKATNKAAKMPEIMDAAIQVIGTKNLSDFTTKSGNANSALYSGILRKYDDVPKGTLKRWLNEDLKSGDFERSFDMLKKKSNS